MHFSINRLIAIILLIALPIGAFAGVAQDATLRMKDRLAQIDSMKSDGSVGENTGGFLEIRTSLGPRQKSMIEAENADRLIVYEEVSKRTDQPVASVGQQRALRIAEIAKKGVWLEKPDGEWYQKP